MEYRTNYLDIHEKAYAQLRARGRSAWSESEDLGERNCFYENTLKQHRIPIGSSILILGCGDGETSLALSTLGYKVTGIDISPIAIQWAKEKADERKIHCSFIVGNLCDSNPLLDHYHAIIDDHCLHCIIGRDRNAVLKSVHSMLAISGIFISRTHCGDPPVDAPSDFFKTWDPVSRCQVHGGVAGRYFGLAEDILKEFESEHLKISSDRVFQYPNGWNMLEVVARKG